MKKTLFIVSVILLLCLFPANSQIQVKAEPDETVELMTVILALTEVPYFNQPAIWPEYKAFVDSYFKDFRDHSAVGLMVKLMNRGKINTIPMPVEIAVNSSIVNGEFVYQGGNITSSGGKKWGKRFQDKFIDEINKFYRETDFPTFYEKARRNYKYVEVPFNDILLPKLNLQWLNEFVPVGETLDYGLTISYLCGDYNYGVSRNGVPNPVMGVFDINGFMNPTPFVLYRVPMVILHEYLHPFCNPLIDKYYPELEEYGKVIFPKISEQAIKSHYTNWRIVLYESLVRASVIAFMHTDDFFRGHIEDEIRQDTRTGIFWTGELGDLLLEYQKNRDRYPTLDSFMPRVVGFYSELAEN